MAINPIPVWCACSLQWRSQFDVWLRKEGREESLVTVSSITHISVIKRPWSLRSRRTRRAVIKCLERPSSSAAYGSERLVEPRKTTEAMACITLDIYTPYCITYHDPKKAIHKEDVGPTCRTDPSFSSSSFEWLLLKCIFKERFEVMCLSHSWHWKVPLGAASENLTQDVVKSSFASAPDH